MDGVVLSPSDFVGLLNQTLEIAYPIVIIEGELSSFRVSKNRWVYFDLKDETASVQFFGSVYQLPGPLEDGLKVRVIGNPRLHPRFGFSISYQSIQPVGEGAIKKAADLLARRLEAEGLFANERKRPLPVMPERIGLITAAASAAYADFIKILNSRWGGVSIEVIDVLVQGDNSPPQLVAAIEHFNKMAHPPEVLVMTRGGGSAEDLASFNDERVVRAVAASRVPMLVAIGHEVDVSLAELAADMRASTPTNAASLVVPDAQQELAALDFEQRQLAKALNDLARSQARDLKDIQKNLEASLKNLIKEEQQALDGFAGLLRLLDPQNALKRGYAIVSKQGRHLKSVSGLARGDKLLIALADGKIHSEITEVTGK